eukprot:1186619-Prorocentrum_minimum.AAC.2
MGTGWGQIGCKPRGSTTLIEYSKRAITFVCSSNASLRWAAARWSRSIREPDAGAVSGTTSVSCPASAASKRRSKCVRVAVSSVFVDCWFACCLRDAAVSAVSNPWRTSLRTFWVATSTCWVVAVCVDMLPCRPASASAAFCARSTPCCASLLTSARLPADVRACFTPCSTCWRTSTLDVTPMVRWDAFTASEVGRIERIWLAPPPAGGSPSSMPATTKSRSRPVLPPPRVVLTNWAEKVLGDSSRSLTPTSPTVLPSSALPFIHLNLSVPASFIQGATCPNWASTAAMITYAAASSLASSSRANKGPIITSEFPPSSFTPITFGTQTRRLATCSPAHWSRTAREMKKSLACWSAWSYFVVIITSNSRGCATFRHSSSAKSCTASISCCACLRVSRTHHLHEGPRGGRDEQHKGLCDDLSGRERDHCCGVSAEVCLWHKDSLTLPLREAVPRSRKKI